MLSLLSDPNDFAFFSYGTYGSGDYFRNRPDRIQYLKKVVDEFEDTVLAQMIAAQIGVESSIQFQDTSYMFYDEERQKDLLDGSLFKQAHKYLTIGDKLPDEFPIREEVLKELGIAEFVKGNHEKAFALLDELSNKYPKGEHGRKASKGKQELIELQKRKQKSPN